MTVSPRLLNSIHKCPWCAGPLRYIGFGHDTSTWPACADLECVGHLGWRSEFSPGRVVVEALTKYSPPLVAEDAAGRVVEKSVRRVGSPPWGSGKHHLQTSK